MGDHTTGLDSGEVEARLNDKLAHASSNLNHLRNLKHTVESTYNGAVTKRDHELKVRHKHQQIEA